MTLELHADLLLLDERKPRHAAVELGIRVIGTIGVLERAAAGGFICDLGAVYDQLRKTDFRINEAILVQSLQTHRSRDSSS